MATMTQDELKALVGRAAVRYVTPGTIVGVGTGSTADHFIAALGDRPERLTVVEGTLEATLDAVAAFSGRH